MDIEVRAFKMDDLPDLVEIWNDVVLEGESFPQREPMDDLNARAFFLGQSRTLAACVDGCVVGLAIVHPNNVGRCGHVANASYAVREGMRGQHIGERLVKASIESARQLGFRILQFNAVVCNNERAIRLYERLGFQKAGMIPGGFQRFDGSFADTFIYYLTL